jgi:3-hydroxyisobutyrate dehydrogenase
MSNPRIAFFGLGIMGSGMARRLLGAGFPLTLFNRRPERAAEFAKAGAKLAESPRAAAADADVLVSMVADDVASRSMWMGEQGALSGVARGAVLIESSTLSVTWVKELAAAAAERGCELLDAPVTGSKTHAAAGELNFFVGGSEAALEKARPVLAAMSRSIVHVGPTGSGALIKIINNFLCGVQAASAAEALALIERSGLNRDKALEILTSGAPGSGVLKTVFPRMTARDFKPNFRLALMAKDLAYSLNEGRERGVELASAAAALETYKQSIASGNGDQDFSSVIELFREAATPPRTK